MVLELASVIKDELDTKRGALRLARRARSSITLRAQEGKLIPRASAAVIVSKDLETHDILSSPGLCAVAWTGESSEEYLGFIAKIAEETAAVGVVLALYDITRVRRSPVRRVERAHNVAIVLCEHLATGLRVWEAPIHYSGDQCVLGKFRSAHGGFDFGPGIPPGGMLGFYS